METGGAEAPPFHNAIVRQDDDSTRSTKRLNRTLRISLREPISCSARRPRSTDERGRVAPPSTDRDPEAFDRPDRLQRIGCPTTCASSSSLPEHPESHGRIRTLLPQKDELGRRPSCHKRREAPNSSWPNRSS